MILKVKLELQTATLWALGRLASEENLTLGQAINVVLERGLSGGNLAKVYSETGEDRPSDRAMAEKLGLTIRTVQRKRINLGLMGQREQKALGIKSQIDKSELEKAITEGGLSMVGFIKLKGLRISRERLRQIANDFEIKQGRKPIWYANRYNLPQLADKEWLTERLKDKRGKTRTLAYELGIGVKIIQNLVDMLGINVDSIPRESIACVELVCSNSECGKKFMRRRILVRKGQRLFFCSKKCQGQYSGKTWGKGKDSTLGASVRES